MRPILFIYLLRIYLSQTTKIHIDKRTNKRTEHGQTETLKHVEKKRIYVKNVLIHANVIQYN